MTDNRSEMAGLIHQLVGDADDYVSLTVSRCFGFWTLSVIGTATTPGCPYTGAGWTIEEACNDLCDARVRPQNTRLRLVDGEPAPDLPSATVLPFGART